MEEDKKPLWFNEYEKRIDNQFEALVQQLEGALKLLDERDISNKAAIKSAFESAERASEKSERAFNEYKAGANEWRETVKDLINNLMKVDAKSEGKAEQKTEGRAQTKWTVERVMVALALTLSVVFSIIGLVRG